MEKLDVSALKTDAMLFALCLSTTSKRHALNNFNRANFFMDVLNCFQLIFEGLTLIGRFSWIVNQAVAQVFLFCF